MQGELFLVSRVQSRSACEAFGEFRGVEEKLRPLVGSSALGAGINGGGTCLFEASQ